MTITVGGSNITFPDSTTQTTAYTGGGVTSAVAGNGVAVSGATGAVTFSASCPTFNTVGSYVWGIVGNYGTAFNVTSGSNYSAGNSGQGVQSYSDVNGTFTNNLSGTWKYMTGTESGGSAYNGLFCRVS